MDTDDEDDDIDEDDEEMQDEIGKSYEAMTRLREDTHPSELIRKTTPSKFTRIAKPHGVKNFLLK